MHSFEKSEDPDEMTHNAAFHQARVYTICKDKSTTFFSENFNL